MSARHVARRAARCSRSAVRRAVLALVVFLAACGGRIDALRARFARDVGCDQGGVNVSSAGGSDYVASGCGRSVTYQCVGATNECSESRDQPATERPPTVHESIPGTDPNLPMQ